MWPAQCFEFDMSAIKYSINFGNLDNSGETDIFMFSGKNKQNCNKCLVRIRKVKN